MRIYDSGKSKSSARSQDIEVFTRNANVFGSRLILMAHNWIPHHQPAVLADHQSPKPPKLPRYYVSPNSMPGLVLAANRIRAKRSSFLALQLFLIVLLTEFGIVYGDARLPTSGDGPLEFSDILPENPKEYDKMQPPKENGRPTTVLFHVTVMSLDSIDESSMTYAADIFFGQNWKDHRLRLPDNMTSEYRLLPVNWLKDMWRPDSFFKNAKKVTFQDMTIPNHYVWLYQDKTILYMVKLTLILSCAMNFQRYPHDEQVCGMKIESLSHTTDDLVFVWDPLVPLVVDKIELPQLDLVSNETADCTQVYSTGNFTCLQVLFTFKRRLGYYLFHTYIPTCLIVIMSWISFWIRPEAVPARVTLGVTSLLTLSTQHANSQKALPPVSYIKAIDMFMSSCTIFVFCSLMEYAMVNVVMGDVIDGDESALKRGMKSIFMATRLISSKQTTARDTSVAVPVSCSHSHLQLPLPSQHVTTSAVPQQHAVQLHNQRLNHRTTQGQRTQSAVSLNAIVPDVTTGTSSGTTSPSQAPLNATLTSSGAALLNTKCENGKQGPSANSVTPVTQPVTQSAEANVAHIYPPTHPPYCRAPAAPPSLSLQQIRRDRAIFIDRVSRVVFPASFALLNVIYWSIFIEW